MKNKIVTLLLASSIACANSFSLDMDENSVVVKGNVDKRHFSIEAKWDTSIRDDFFQLDLSTSDVVMDTMLIKQDGIVALQSEETIFDNFNQSLSYSTSKEIEAVPRTSSLNNSLGGAFNIIFANGGGTLQFFSSEDEDFYASLGEIEANNEVVKFSKKGTAAAFRRIFDDVYYSDFVEYYPVLAYRGCSSVSVKNGLECVLKDKEQGRFLCSIEEGFLYRVSTECE